MKRIYKYPLQKRSHQTVLLPDGAVVLSAVNQMEYLMLYALVDDDIKPTVETNIIIRGTGSNADTVHLFQFVDTVLFDKGTLVFHVFTDGAVIRG